MEFETKAQSPLLGSTAHERLNNILDIAEPVASEEDGKTGLTPPQSDSESSRNKHPEMTHLSIAQTTFLNHLGKYDLVRVVDQMQSGQTLQQIFEEMSQQKEEAASQAEAQQYSTVEGLLKDEAMKNMFLSSIAERNSNQYLSIARHVPLRLTYDERQLLRLLESTLEVSEYTDKVDILFGGNIAARMANEIRKICAILSGLVVAKNYERGQLLLKNRDYAKNAEFFQSVFEIGRRYKILNPERKRLSYGKLVYMLMDSRKHDVQDLLEFDCVTPVKTVYSLLENRKCGLELLRDPLVTVATSEIMPENKTRSQIQSEIRRKEDAIKQLCQKYAVQSSQSKHLKLLSMPFRFFNRDDTKDKSSENIDSSGERCLTVDEVEQCLYSLSDYNTYLRFNRDPCTKMISFLREFFDPDHPGDDGFSLSITAGHEGARLSHSHNRQYMYALQSLTLWQEIANNMFLLWHRVESDLLDPRDTYRLRDTGQGLNRIQAAPSVMDAMLRILGKVQRSVSCWIGSSMIHLGDHNVPNALMFIDKYTQVPRILSPIVLCIEKIPELYQSTDAMRRYIDQQFGGPLRLSKYILCDFIRHAFDGSGADNFYDAGSCIDGRLTSAWNWCNNIEKKPFFSIFLLTGFNGFDGSF